MYCQVSPSLNKVPLLYTAWVINFSINSQSVFAIYIAIEIRSNLELKFHWRSLFSEVYIKTFSIYNQATDYLQSQNRIGYTQAPSTGSIVGS
jgi:hypothetical protein